MPSRRSARPGPGEAASAADDGVRRRRILDAAERRFAEHGFDATPTAGIAADAEVPKGLLFYYFPRKVDLLRALLDERLPSEPLCRVQDVALCGDPVGSLSRLARRLRFGEHQSPVLRTIIFREASTHPEVRQHIGRLREGLLELTESVIDTAFDHSVDPRRRRQAAQTFVAVILDEANARRFDGPVPDVEAAAEIVAGALTPG